MDAIFRSNNQMVTFNFSYKKQLFLLICDDIYLLKHNTLIIKNITREIILENRN